MCLFYFRNNAIVLDNSVHRVPVKEQRRTALAVTTYLILPMLMVRFHVVGKQTDRLIN